MSGTVADSTRLARDGFFVAVGFGVLGVQKLQVRRRELESQLAPGAHLQHVQRVVGSGLREVEERLVAVEARVDEALVGAEAMLPEATREVVQQARDVARVARSQLVDLLAGPPPPGDSRPS